MNIIVDTLSLCGINFINTNQLEADGDHYFLYFSSKENVVTFGLLNNSVVPSTLEGIVHDEEASPTSFSFADRPYLAKCPADPFIAAMKFHELKEALKDKGLVVSELPYAGVEMIYEYLGESLRGHVNTQPAVVHLFRNTGTGVYYHINQSSLENPTELPHHPGRLNRDEPRPKVWANDNTALRTGWEGVLPAKTLVDLIGCLTDTGSVLDYLYRLDDGSGRYTAVIGQIEVTGFVHPNDYWRVCRHLIKPNVNLPQFLDDVGEVMAIIETTVSKHKKREKIALELVTENLPEYLQYLTPLIAYWKDGDLF